MCRAFLVTSLLWFTDHVLSPTDPRSLRDGGTFLLSGVCVPHGNCRDRVAPHPASVLPVAAGGMVTSLA